MFRVDWTEEKYKVQQQHCSDECRPNQKKKTILTNRLLNSKSTPYKRA